MSRSKLYAIAVREYIKSNKQSENALRRPVLIVQDDQYNKSNIATVIVLSITSTIRLADLPGNILLSKKDSGLPKESVINVTQIATIDKSWVETKAGALSKPLMEEVDYGIGMVLGLHF
ncbi:MAG: type II toxin-antitoxin system PemK/MazF family toxin [Proteobacteria bacterium]|nr:type II toxin-antitoxin system PemK/MazF family toxin [Pseudomonadota bacterium]